MPVEFDLKSNGVRVRESVTGSVEIIWIARGSTDELEVRDEALLQLPEEYDGRPRRDVDVESIFDDGGLWSVKVRYADLTLGQLPAPEAGDSAFEFSTGGGAVHITQSKETISGYVPEGVSTMPNFSGAIGVNENGVEGVDVTIPQYQWSETHYRATAPTWFRRNVYRTTGKVNDAPFRGFDRGEVLLLEVSGRYRQSDGVWEIVYRFGASENVENLVIGEGDSEIVVEEKEGWHYLWVLYDQVEDETAKRVVRRPRAAYVERVYDYANFGLLEIGVAP